MYKTGFVASLLAATLISAAPASAQGTSQETGTLILVEAGAQAVQNVGGMGGVQIGRRLSPKLDVFVEGVYLQDVVTRRRADSATTLAAYLAVTQGKAASGAVQIPAGTFVGGVRYFVADTHGVHVYVSGFAGMTRATLKPTFMLGGVDVTTTLPQYGVTLGSDMTGTTTKATLGGGVGAQRPLGAWYLDAGIRVYSIQFEGQAANTINVAVGIGRKF